MWQQCDRMREHTGRGIRAQEGEVNVSPELRTALERGIPVAVIGGALAFFTALGTEAEWRTVISLTGVGFFTPLGGFFGWGLKDQQLAQRPGTPQAASRAAERQP